MKVLGILASLLIVVASTAVYTLFIWWADRYEKEPKRLLFFALFWGAVPAAVLSLLGELNLSMPGQGITQEILSSGIAGPIIEEVAKGLMLVLLLNLHFFEFDGILDGIVYGALVGFGFGMTENFIYLVASLDEGALTWTGVLILRQFVFGLNHAFYTAFTGIGFGLARSRAGRSRLLYPFLGLALGILFHALHNITISLTTVSAIAFLFTLLFDAGGIFLVVVVLVVAILREKRIIEEELEDEIGHTLSAEDFHRISRVQLPLMGVRDEERKRLREVRQLAAELALKKRQLRQDEENRSLRLRITQLRAALIALRQAGEGKSTTEG